MRGVLSDSLAHIASAVDEGAFKVFQRQSELADIFKAARTCAEAPLLLSTWQHMLRDAHAPWYLIPAGKQKPSLRSRWVLQARPPDI